MVSHFSYTNSFPYRKVIVLRLYIHSCVHRRDLIFFSQQPIVRRRLVELMQEFPIIINKVLFHLGQREMRLLEKKLEKRKLEKHSKWKLTPTLYLYANSCQYSLHKKSVKEKQSKAFINTSSLAQKIIKSPFENLFLSFLFFFYLDWSRIPKNATPTSLAGTQNYYLGSTDSRCISLKWGLANNL